MSADWRWTVLLAASCPSDVSEWRANRIEREKYKCAKRKQENSDVGHSCLVTIILLEIYLPAKFSSNPEKNTSEEVH